jgi:phosphate transport system protein
MGQLTMKMVQNAIQAYVDKDEQAARDLLTLNSQLADYSNEIIRESYGQIQQDPEVVVAAITYNRVAADLIRIADYMINVGEWIIYLKTGKIVELKLMQ